MHLDVLHVLSSNQRRGAEAFGYDLHRALRERGVRSEIRCLEPSEAEPRLPVAEFAKSRFSLTGLRALRRRARQARAVVAHGSNTLLACGAGLVGTGVPFVYVSIGDPRYWAGTSLRRTRAGWLIRRAAAVVAISPSAYEVLVRHYGLDAGRVHVIPNGRSAAAFAPADFRKRDAARKQLGLPATADLVAAVGALSPEKRVNDAIAAVATLLDVALVVAGDGPERSALEALARRVAPGRVHFLGATEGAETVLAAVDALVLSSASEGVPGVLIEAGLSGLPVVATDVGWVRDVVVPGHTGLLVPPKRPDLLASALRSALTQREALGNAAREHCRATFDMKTVTDKWQRVLESVARP
ncbi:MAG TPA: glycosyltransferase family 4 protein [Jiangellaceae bacterium]|nr:glycosyltransferase family 4 protein [Jiangellaceae bacterium]